MLLLLSFVAFFSSLPLSPPKEALSFSPLKARSHRKRAFGESARRRGGNNTGENAEEQEEPQRKAQKRSKPKTHRDDDVTRSVGRHERVPVPVPPHPAAEPEQRPVQRQPRLPDLRQRGVDAAVEQRQRRRDRLVEVGEPLPHLGLRRRLLPPDLVGAPRALHLRLDVLEALEPLVGGHARVVEPVHGLADRAVLLQQGLAQRLRRVRREDERDLLFAQRLVDQLRGGAVGRDELLEGAVGGAGGLLDLFCFCFVFVERRRRGRG